VLPSIAMAEVKLILKSSSEQAKKKLLEHGGLDKEQVEFYKESIAVFDSVEMADYEKL
jgi:molybdopterin-containing oxidoreductase family membrane subunit